MALATKRYTHIPLHVEAVQVSVENMAEVAEWAGGKIEVDPSGKQHVKISTIRPIHKRDTQAFVGDWVLKTDIGLKVYTNKNFSRGFIPLVETSVN